MANKVRGELEIELGGARYVLRPSFEAIANAEDKAGIGITGIANKFVKQQQGLKDVAVLIWAGMVGGGVNKFTFEQVGQMIQKSGYAKYVQPAFNFAIQACRGDVEIEEDEEEKKEQPVPS